MKNKKTYLVIMLLASICGPLFAGNVSLVSDAAASTVVAPEFDGIYIETKDGKLVELVPTKCYKSQVWSGRNLSVMDMVNAPLIQYAYPDMRCKNVNVNDFVAIKTRGVLFKYHDVHRVGWNVLDGKTSGFFENKGPGVEGKPFYFAHSPIDLRSKSIGQDSIYYKPKEALAAGPYCLIDGKNYYAFNLIDPKSEGAKK